MQGLIDSDLSVFGTTPTASKKPDDLAHAGDAFAALLGTVAPSQDKEQNSDLISLIEPLPTALSVEGQTNSLPDNAATPSLPLLETTDVQSVFPEEGIETDETTPGLGFAASTLSSSLPETNTSTPGPSDKPPLSDPNSVEPGLVAPDTAAPVAQAEATGNILTENAQIDPLASQVGAATTIATDEKHSSKSLSESGFGDNRSGLAFQEIQNSSAEPATPISYSLSELSGSEFGERHAEFGDDGFQIKSNASALSGASLNASATGAAAELSFVSSSGPSSPSVPSPSPAPQNATIVSTPAALSETLTQALSSVDEQNERLVVQLDPPELGRVSIDYKFDGIQLQHVTVTGESPEAMRQLRQMHHELVQALEQHGLSSKDMSFQQRDSSPGNNGSGWNTQSALEDDTGNSLSERSARSLEAAFPNNGTPDGLLEHGRLNLKL